MFNKEYDHNMMPLCSNSGLVADVSHGIRFEIEGFWGGRPCLLTPTIFILFKIYVFLS
jgi:hypothetical protein